MTNSEIFERVAKRELSAEEAARTLLEQDAIHRRERVKEGRPRWMPAAVWAVASVIVIALLDAFSRRA